MEKEIGSKVPFDFLRGKREQFSMEIDLTGKRAVVTGASSGIGAAIAQELAARGAQVLGTYRSSMAGGIETQQAVRSKGGTMEIVKCSVGDHESVASLFAKADELWGGVDIVISNAGMDGTRKKLWEIDKEDWTRVIEVNLEGTYYVAAEGLRRMVEQGKGVFLTVSSVHEKVPWGGHTAYSASKAGLGMMIQSLALELADTGVRAVSLAPGAIKTDINKDVWDNPETMDDLRTKIPMNRMGTVEETARTAAFLVSDLASYITGTTIYVDGGMGCYPSFAKGG